MLLITVLFVLFAYILLKYISIVTYWKKRSVKHVTPLSRSSKFWPFLFGRISFPEYLTGLYNQHPDERYIGIYTVGQPVLLIRDPELIKTITIKEFDCFTDHARLFNRDADPLWGRNIMASEGRRWKNLRYILSPAFSKSKMNFIHKATEELVQNLIDHLKQDNDVLEVELDEIFKPLIIDILASTTFGINCNSTADKNNVFIRYAKRVMDFAGLKKLKFVAYNLSPYLVKILNLKFYNDEVSNYFRAIIKDIMETRTRMNITRPDVMNTLMDAKKGKYYSAKNDRPTNISTEELLDQLNVQPTFEITDDDITAQALLMFFAGFETLTGLVNFCIYELVANSRIQKRLTREIDENVNQYGKITYKGLHQMKYLDMVIQETLRKWPMSMFLDRKVNKAYTIEPEREDEKPLHLTPGDLCWIPMFPIHRDPKYWPNPEIFDPERFNQENRPKINPSVFMPFGAGPRICLAYKYSIMLSKIVIFHLLSTFEVISIEKTRIPMVIDKSNLVISPIHGFWFGFKRRKDFEKTREAVHQIL